MSRWCLPSLGLYHPYADDRRPHRSSGLTSMWSMWTVDFTQGKIWWFLLHYSPVGTDQVAVLLKLKDPTVCFAFKCTYHCWTSSQEKLFWTDRGATKKGNSCRLFEKTHTGLLVQHYLSCILLLVRTSNLFTLTNTVQGQVCVTHCNTPKHLNARVFIEVSLLWVNHTGKSSTRYSQEVKIIQKCTGKI